MDMRFVDLHCDTIGEHIARSDGAVTLRRNEIGRASCRDRV